MNLKIYDLFVTFKDWFFNQYLDWQRKNGKASATKFAHWIGISQTSCNQYLSGVKKPRGENLFKIASKLGYEAYDLLGYVRPDEGLKELTKLYSDIPDEEKDTFMDLIREYKKTHGL
jgi:hypothetical protein